MAGLDPAIHTGTTGSLCRERRPISVYRWPVKPGHDGKIVVDGGVRPFARHDNGRLKVSS
jgi:hypothetical protein